MNQFFELVISRPKASDDGRMKNFSYLVEADTYTEAEAAGYKIMEKEGFEKFNIAKITKLDVNSVYLQDLEMDLDSNFFCQVKLAMTAIDERSGLEVVVDKYNYIILTSSFQNATAFALGLFTDDVKVISQKQTNLVAYYSRADLDTAQAGHAEQDNI